MYIHLYRNQPKGNAITGRLVINGQFFCYTMERVGYQIPALCYHVIVTQSPKFKRLLPLVTGVPRLPIGGTPSNSEASDRAKPVQYPAAGCRTGIRFHRGTKPEHSTGCILVVADNNPMPLHATPYTLHPPQGRTAADVEQELTRLILNTQNAHEEIILEVIDFRPGTEYGYNTPCPSSECACEKEIRSAHFARRHSSSILEATSFSDDC